MISIFISYRRDDAFHASARVHERLEKEFGRDLLFMDVDAIPLGVNFAKVLIEEVSKCDVLLAVIGPKWLSVTDDAGQRRLDNPNDFVRIEVSAALARDIPVIPVLLDGTPVPKTHELPLDLQELSMRNGLEVRGLSFHRDIDTLINGLKPNKPKSDKSTNGITVDVGVVGRSAMKQFVPGNGRTMWFQDVATGPEMVVIPPGEFVMGAPPDEQGRDNTEGPQHVVVISEPFAVGRFAVTLGEFTTFVEATSRQIPDKMYTFEEDDWNERTDRSFRNPGFNQTSRHPVVGTDWNDATSYCAWLSELTGKSYRLLSEGEWEYAARAGTTTPFWWGAEISTAQANYDGCYTYGSSKKGELRKSTLPVDSFNPNHWGIYQMHGNVWEWCADNWHENYSGEPSSDGSVWQGGDASLRVLRGGSWSNSPELLRSANRDGDQPDSRNYFIGFRIARTLTP